MRRDLADASASLLTAWLAVRQAWLSIRGAEDVAGDRARIEGLENAVESMRQDLLVRSRA